MIHCRLLRLGYPSFNSVCSFSFPPFLDSRIVITFSHASRLRIFTMNLRRLLCQFLHLFPSEGDYPHADGIRQICQICVYANSAANPLIYNAVNEQFREGFKTYFRSWIECVLKIKRSKRRDDLKVTNRRNGAKPIGTCTMCGSSDTSLDGTLYSQKQQLQVNNNGGAQISMNGTTDTKDSIESEADKVEEHKELLTSV